MPPRRPGDSGLPRDPFGRRDVKPPAGRLDFLFDGKRHPEPGAVRPEPAVATTITSEAPPPPLEPPPAEPVAAASAQLPLGATPTAPAIELGPPPPMFFYRRSSRHLDSPPPAPARGFKRDFQPIAFVPQPLIVLAEVVAIVVCGVIAAVFRPRDGEIPRAQRAASRT